MSSMSVDWTKLYKQYKGLWVALADDETTVLGSGERAQDALKMAKEHGAIEPILMRLPKKLTYYVGRV
jgi:hypothetical protein